MTHGLVKTDNLIFLYNAFVLICHSLPISQNLIEFYDFCHPLTISSQTVPVPPLSVFLTIHFRLGSFMHNTINDLEPEC